MERPLKDFSDTELKAIGYEATKELQRLSQTLQAIETELASRAKKAQENKKMEEEVKVEEVTPEVETTETVEEQA